jgi:hypothetical protein
MAVHGGDHLQVERLGRIEARAPVIGQCGIDRQPPRCRLDSKPLQPLRRHEIEQGRGGDQIQSPVEGQF